MHRSHRGASCDLRLSVGQGLRGKSDNKGDRDQISKGLLGVFSSVVCCQGYKISSRRAGKVKEGLKKA